MSFSYHPGRPGAGRMSGFTMIEMMIVVAMSAVLVAVASPSFMATVRVNRLDVSSGDLRSAVMLARSEAIKRARLVIVEPLTSGVWTGGFRVYADADQDPTNSYNSGTDILVRQMASMRNIVASGAPQRRAFNSRGENVSLAALSANRVPTTSTVGLCIAPSKRTVTINPAGFVSYAQTSC
jgi:prepilin-type N-terminal cleavage/methylation domain-containing protein